VTPDEARETTVAGMADDALASARSELDAGRLHFAVNRAYYACFYSASGVLLHRGLKFKRHSGVRVAIHQHLVNKGVLSSEWGGFYSQLFGNRQEGDYRELTQFDVEEVTYLVERAEKFVGKMRTLLPKDLEPE